MNVLVTGGYFDDSGEGVLWHVDLAAGRAQVLLQHRPHDSLHVSGKGFTGATWCGSGPDADLMVCGFNALYRVRREDWSVTGLLHQPCMNDLHHVALIGGHLHVVNTGLDSVDVFTLAGGFVGSYATAPAWLQAARLAGATPSRESWANLLCPGWDLQAPMMDSAFPDGRYFGERASVSRPFHQRVVADYVHPNHISEAHGRLLCTSLAQSRLVDLRTQETVVTDLPGHPHDGILVDGQLHVTCVGGYVLSFQPSAAAPWAEVHRVDLVETTKRKGWCRALHVTQDVMVVGLTEIRERSFYTWRNIPFEGTETSVLVVDRNDGRLLQRVDLTDRIRHSKIFSVLPL